MATVNCYFVARLLDGIATEADTPVFLAVPDSTTLATLIAAQNAWVSALDAITDGFITSQFIGIEPPLAAGVKGSGAASVANSRASQAAVFDFANTFNSRRSGLAVPTFSSSKIVSGAPNLADSAVAAYTALLLAAVAGGSYTTPFYLALSSLLDAYLSFRRRFHFIPREYV